jgi:hypothetical protein
MLSKAFEFVRIADTNPGDEKVRRRKEAAASLIEELTKNRDLLLSVLQGVVFGFDKPPLRQDSPAVQSTLKAVKGPDTAFPEDLTENAMELRAVAAIAIGEILAPSATEQGASSNSVLTALCLRSALALRAPEKNQHLRNMAEALASAAESVSASEAQNRRQRSSVSARAFEALELTSKEEEEDEESEKSLDDVLPLIKSALGELQDNAAKDREELDTLWWLFAEYSETRQKPMRELSVAAAAFCSGLELAERSLLPPSGSTAAMVGRALQSSHPADATTALKLEAAINDWTRPMIDALMTPQSPVRADPELYPALLPLSWACQRSLKDGGGPELDKSFTKVTGIDKKREAIPAEWGTQIFLERCVLRLLAGKEN